MKRGLVGRKKRRKDVSTNGSKFVVVDSVPGFLTSFVSLSYCFLRFHFAIHPTEHFVSVPTC
jgi:hypothetical protein